MLSEVSQKEKCCYFTHSYEQSKHMNKRNTTNAHSKTQRRDQRFQRGRGLGVGARGERGKGVRLHGDGE